MSLWTPSGEHPVDRRGSSGPGASRPATEPSSGGASTAPPGGPAAGGEPGAGAADAPGAAPSLEDLTPEQRAQVEEMARQMEAAQARMLQMPVGQVVGQHALQLYELAALYLSQDPPRLADARTSIDAFAAVVERLGDRLGDAHQPLRQALNQIQLAFVQVRGNPGDPVGGSTPPA
jgi:hypothetical protein